MDEINSQNPQFFVGFVSPVGVLDIWWVVTPERHTFERMFSIGTVCSKLFPVGCAQDTEKNHRFGSGSAHVTDLRNFYGILF